MANGEAKQGIARKAYWIGGGVLVLGLLVLLAYLRPMAPSRIDFFTGPKGSAYHTLGLRIASLLEEHRITVRVVETQGAVENLRRLGGTDGTAIGLAPSRSEKGLEDPAAITNLISLGSIAFEPLWLFTRKDAHIKGIRDLPGHTVGVGQESSGSRAVADLLLDANGVTDRIRTTSRTDLVDAAAADALLRSEIDAVFLVGSMRSEVVARLLGADEAEPLSFPRADTYAILFPGLARFDVPPGGFDLASDIPATTVETLAATTNLVSTEGLHGALVEVLIDVLQSKETQPSLENPEGVFPSARYVSLPLDPRARRFYKDGPSKLSQVLPYWAAAVVDQIVFVLLPALAVLFTILKVVPLLLGMRFSLRSLSLTRRMVRIERDSAAGKDSALLWKELDDVDRESATMQVPPTKAAEYIELRQNIHDGRERIQARAEGGGSPPFDA